MAGAFGLNISRKITEERSTLRKEFYIKFAKVLKVSTYLKHHPKKDIAVKTIFQSTIHHKLLLLMINTYYSPHQIRKRGLHSFKFFTVVF